MKKTAMMELREKLQETASQLEVEAISDVRISGYREALLAVVKDIDAQMLQTERQMIADIIDSSRDMTKEQWSNIQQWRKSLHVKFHVQPLIAGEKCHNNPCFCTGQCKNQVNHS